MNVIESIILAIGSVKANKLRASLTLLSISIGVFAIIGAGTLVSSINNAITGELAAMGETSFYIFRMPKIQTGHTWRKYERRKPISYSQYREFKKKMTSAKMIGADVASGGYVVKFENNETNPDVSLLGTDDTYFELNNVGVTSGRPFSPDDIEFNRNVAIIGNDVAVKVFPNIDPLGKKIKIGNQLFDVIGILEVKGAVLGQSQDNKVLVPVQIFLKYFSNRWSESLEITIKAWNKESMAETIDEAIGIMRTIRNVQPWEENSFEVETNESIEEQFSSFTSYLTYFGFFSGAIALIAAGVGIMNIMLVSVKERTREIGIRKAVGAKRTWILLQFIIETITLCQLGGAIGIGMGILGAWMLGNAIQINIVFPMDWIIFSIVICTVLGVVSGSYPAWRAAVLDPIEALRYE